jgi:organic radical activating enzyme
MTALNRALRRIRGRVDPLPPGLYARKAPPDSPLPYRLHLRLEADGRGVLLINAATILHLNPTAAEYAYHLLQGTPPEEVASFIAGRYRVTREQAARDYADFVDRVEALYLDPERAPVNAQELERLTPYSGPLSAPYRLDCALTYRMPTDAFAVPAGPAGGELATEDWQKILDVAWGAGIPHVVFTGGEPTIRPDLAALLAHAEHLGMVTGLVSDGARLAESAYLDELLQAGLDHVTVVLGSHTGSRTPSARDWDALSGIIYWAEVLEARLHTAAHLTLTPENTPEIPIWLDRLAETGVHAVSLSASQPSLARELATACDRAAAAGLPLNWELAVPYFGLAPAVPEAAGEADAIGAGRAWLYVEPDGDVLPAQGAGRVLGNMLRDPWEKIWNSLP